MTAQKHTPGPWIFEDYSQGKPEFFVIPSTYFGTVAKVFNEGDARLISAAPDMLEALLEAKSEMRDWSLDHPAMRQIDAAIAKATGQ